MIPQDLLELMRGGESSTVEFKKSRTELTKDVYESVCAFSNRDGGHIFLGVADDGEILGIEAGRVDKIKKDFVTAVNNENKMYPPLYLTPIAYESEGKQILYIRVPAAQTVCRVGGRIFDRNYEADIDITRHADEVFRLYARKSGTYYVNKVTGFGHAALRDDLLARAREMTRAQEQKHPWRFMSDEEMLRSAGLLLTDERTGQEGLTEALINSAAPS